MSRAHQEGRTRRHERGVRDAMAVVTPPRRSGVTADGEVVWFWRPDAGAKLATMLSHRGQRRGQESPVPGKSAKETVKPSCRECRIVSAYL